ncbi:hypothetical protein KP509_25G069000 [Ceratopteris richardii]|uniref:Calcineurin-like phosphoesterase domain-containing protein n=1 Tax=Ceratopteris richardii TaxID=49495 RepID=A0A8T2RR92_CERRI|nr:hypothetical protein KP509_25G069000 [Ceratopteris richardii]
MYTHTKRNCGVNPLIPFMLVDGKSKDLATMRQDESEWLEYKDALDWVVSQSGLPMQIFFDVRGNHDKFGVPEIGGHLDYYAKYSITARQNRSGPVHSITLQNGDWKHLFVGIDLSMEIGLRGPCNVFGHPSDQTLDLLNKELSKWDNNNQKVTKIVFGHFPTSFIAGTEDGKRPEELFGRHNILAYICGHLHYQFGKKLFKYHMLNDGKEFWEWELGDWKENRVARILAIDNGHASFLDLDLLGMKELDTGHELLESKDFILITYPLDAQKMQRQGYALNGSVNDFVRALVFTQREVTSAKAVVYDFPCCPENPSEEFMLEQLSVDVDNTYYFAAPLNLSGYYGTSRNRFLLKVVAFDSSGKQIESDLRLFSSDGCIEKLRWSWSEYFCMDFVLEALYPLFLRAAFFMLLGFLIAPKLYVFFVLKKGLTFGPSQKKKSPSTWNDINEVIAYIENASTTTWLMELILVLYLMFMPWFWGSIFGDSYPLGSMSVRGWSVNNLSSLGLKQGLGVPDVMVIVLPFLYHILLPLFVFIYALHAERAFVCIHMRNDKHRKSMEADKSVEPYSCKVCARWSRKALLFICLGVLCLHAQVDTFVAIVIIIFHRYLFFPSECLLFRRSSKMSPQQLVCNEF